MIEINKNFFGFNNKNNKLNSILYVVENYSEFLQKNTINESKKKYFKKAIKNNTQLDIIYISEITDDIFEAVLLLKPSKIHRKSTIDQAAKAAKYIHNTTWNVNFSPKFNNEVIYDFLFGWGLSFYKFTIEKIKDNIKYLNLKSLEKFPLKLIEKCKSELTGIYIARNLINLPPNFLNPSEYEKQIFKVFKNEKVKLKVFKGKNFNKSFPLIDFVGRASEHEPRLIEITFNETSRRKKPNVVLIGKGITFDSGGLDLKPSSSMLLMKKDMAGSAIAIALAKTIISLNYKINLKLLIPIAENFVSHKSMRPMDIVYSRNKTPVEIGNTDAEGRLILADSLTFSQESKSKPDLIVDFATLTGAARVALGTEMPAFFSNNKHITKTIIENSIKFVDPLWELPLFTSYERHLKNDNGSISSTGFSGTGGAITAALFLKKFVEKNINWVHIDLMGWNLHSRAGFPKGGEAMSFRAILESINELYN